MNSREIRTRLRDAGLPTVIVDIFTSYENDIRFLKKEIAKLNFKWQVVMSTLSDIVEGLEGMDRVGQNIDEILRKEAKESKANEIVFSEPIDVVGDPKNNE